MRFIFLYGSLAVCRRLSFLISEDDFDTCEVSLSAPLRQAAIGLFFNGDPTIDIEEQKELKIGEKAFTPRALQLFLHAELERRCGPGALGHLAKQWILENDILSNLKQIVVEDAGPDLEADLGALESLGGESLRIHIPLIPERATPQGWMRFEAIPSWDDETLLEAFKQFLLSLQGTSL